MFWIWLYRALVRFASALCDFIIFLCLVVLFELFGALAPLLCRTYVCTSVLLFIVL